MFNCEAYLRQVVDSVLRQTFADWELVLFDDGSRDQTVSIAREYAGWDRRIRVVEGTNGGTARARNRGLAASTSSSEFVIFLDNDDVWEANALEVLTRALEKDPAAPAAHGLARSVDPDGQPIPGDDLEQAMLRRHEVRKTGLVELPPDAPTTFNALLVENYPVTPGTMLVRRSVRETVGDYIAEAVPCDDWDMHLRIARYGGIALVNQVVLNWRRYPGAASHTTSRWRDAYVKVRKRSVLSAENDDDQRRAALSAFRLVCRRARAEASHQLARGEWKAGARALARWGVLGLAYWQVVRAAGSTGTRR